MTKQEIEKDLYELDSSAQAAFRRDFSTEISQFVRGFLKAYECFEELQRDMTNRRHGLVEGFLLNALDCLLVSTKLLIGGLLLPAGNSIRNFNESLTLALLCSSKKLDVFDQIEADPQEYRYDRAVSKLEKRETVKALELERTGVKSIRRIASFYNKYSHATYFSLRRLFDMSGSGKIYLGGFYDNSLKYAYEKKMKTRLSACEHFCDIVSIIGYEFSLQ